MFVDGHVEIMTVLQPIRERKWGDHFYSVTAGNAKGVNCAPMEPNSPLTLNEGVVSLHCVPHRDRQACRVAAHGARA